MHAILDYWCGDATPGESDRLEELTFACDACARKLAVVVGFARGVARVAAIRGGIAMVVTQAMIDRLAHGGLKMRHYLVHAGQTIQCTIGADDDLSVTYLTAGLRDVQRVDVVSYVDGKVWSRIDDAPFDRATGQVIYTVGGNVARTFRAITVRVELLAIEREGATRSLGDYVFEHTPYTG